MPIYATGAGVVSIAGWVRGYGNLVEIEHAGGVRTRYGHLSSISVGRGAAVGQGEPIGRMGSTGRSTGTHLHYEVRVQGVPVNPLDYIGQTHATYQTATWVPVTAAKVAPRWTGWQLGQDERARLPEPRIR